MKYTEMLNDKRIKKLIKWYDNGGHEIVSHADLKKFILKIARSTK